MKKESEFNMDGKKMRSPPDYWQNYKKILHYMLI